MTFLIDRNGVVLTNQLSKLEPCPTANLVFLFCLRCPVFVRLTHRTVKPASERTAGIYYHRRFVPAPYSV